MRPHLSFRKGFLPLLLALFLVFSASSGASSPVIPSFSGEAVTEWNRNVPALSSEAFPEEDFISYSELDSLGRPGAVTACLSRDSIPEELRSDSSSRLPAGWSSARYDELIDGYYLYSICSLLPPALGGDSSDMRNVFTGTRYLRTRTLQVFEKYMADLLSRSSYHVRYRVTPLYQQAEDLVPFCLHLEACTVEDGGRTLRLNVLLYNVQPGIAIDYATGSSQQLTEPSDILSSAEDFLAARQYPAPASNEAPQDSSFRALGNRLIDGVSDSASSAASGTQAASSAPVTVTLLRTRSGNQYHASADCSSIGSDMAVAVKVDLAQKQPADFCPNCCQQILTQYYHWSP